jgi:DNA mismatch repair protein MutS2
MNQHGLRVIQYPETLDLVAGFASSPLGAEAVRGLVPSALPAWVEQELRRVDQMVSFLLRSEDWVVPALPDLRLALRRLAVAGSVWEGPVLRDAGELLRSARATRRAILRYASDYPLLAAIAERLSKLEAEEQAIARAVDEAGEVRDEASRELARLRREIRGARGRIVDRLQAYIANLPERIRVPDASISIREGRYVVPVRREGRSEVGGLVHDESATGATLFVEPPVAIELMNRLRELELAEAREVQRILRELTERLRPHQAELVVSLEALVELDSLYARARYALAYNGRRPELLPAGAEGYTIVEGYHPLLLAGAERAIPFDLHLEAGERTLLVSGPNTGGKTVFLKAIGLLSALAQAGIIPPVGPGTRLPILAGIYADIGDEQSIEASLSTFSAHLKNLREVLAGADHESLVLIDEIGSGTDPAEGGALAQSILIELTRRNALTVATTHLGQLKLLAGDEPGVVNASLQFDAVELRPTYRLLKGVPGRSYGLAIARRLGLPAAVLERAESFVPRGEREVSQLLLELEEKERLSTEALAAADAARAEAVALRQQLEEREHQVRKREREAEQRARQQARDLLLGARAEVEAAISELREAAAEAAVDRATLDEAARRARRRVEEKARRQAERTPRAGGGALAAAGPAEAAALEEGGRVRVIATGAVGTLIELRDGRATVETSGLRLQVPVSGLAALGPGEAAAQPKRKSGGWTAPEVQASPEVDLRGLRFDEVEGRLEPALDAALRAGLPSLRIIHGKGTGAVRDRVVTLLEGYPWVRSFRPGELGEGGTGVTVVELE